MIFRKVVPYREIPGNAIPSVSLGSLNASAGNTRILFGADKDAKSERKPTTATSTARVKWHCSPALFPIQRSGRTDIASNSHALAFHPRQRDDVVLRLRNLYRYILVKTVQKFRTLFKENCNR